MAVAAVDMGGVKETLERKQAELARALRTRASPRVGGAQSTRQI